MKLCLLYGGESVEHEVSIMSAKSVVNNLSLKMHEVVLIYIDRNGKWFQVDDFNMNRRRRVGFLPGTKGEMIFLDDFSTINIDVVFPVLHGGNGENGVLQGYLDVIKIPYVGCGVFGSVVGIGKNVQREMLSQRAIAVVDCLIIDQDNKINFNNVVDKIGLPFFVKPNSQGSSIGVSKVANKNEYEKAIDLAFKYDHKVLLERFCSGREIEISVMGNSMPKVSVPGEVIVKQGWYDYENKYISDEVEFDIPAKLNSKQLEEVQNLAMNIYKMLRCRGLARVDFFLVDDRWVFNEINTMPGFTQTSMYPRLWEASGLKYEELLNRLLELAYEK